MVTTAAPRLVADIGGTNTRLALADGAGVLHCVHSLRTADHATPEQAIGSYLAQHGARPDSACLAVAGPVRGDRVRLTNHPWEFSIAQLRSALGLQRLRVINDFEAVALSIPSLDDNELHRIGGGTARSGWPCAVLGPGTGLGVAQLIHTPEGFEAIATEGGHATIGAHDEQETRLFAMRASGGLPIVREALLSGPGLEWIYRTLCCVDEVTRPDHDAAAIQAHAVAGDDEYCRRALEQFCAFLGTAAADQVLCCGALGGVYLGGGIVTRFIPFLCASAFRARFEERVAMRPYLQQVPCFVISAAQPGLRGAALARLSTHAV